MIKITKNKPGLWKRFLWFCFPSYMIRREIVAHVRETSRVFQLSDDQLVLVQKLSPAQSDELREMMAKKRADLADDLHTFAQYGRREHEFEQHRDSTLASCKHCGLPWDCYDPADNGCRP